MVAIEGGFAAVDVLAVTERVRPRDNAQASRSSVMGFAQVRALGANLRPALAATAIIDAMLTQRAHRTTRVWRYGLGRTPFLFLGFPLPRGKLPSEIFAQPRGDAK